MLIKVLLTLFFLVAALSFLYNLLAAFRNRRKVLEQFPQAASFIPIWILTNALAIAFLLSGTGLLWWRPLWGAAVGLVPSGALVVVLIRHKARQKRVNVEPDED